MSDTWVKETLELIEELQKQKDELENQVEVKILEIEELQKQIEGAEALIPRYRSKHNMVAVPTWDIKPGYFSNKSYPEMLTEIATKLGGYFKVMDAAEIMHKAGVSDDIRQIQSNIYAVINRNKNRYVKVRKGEYRYTNGLSKGEVIVTHKKKKQKRSHRSNSGVREVIKELKDDNPQMTKKEVLNYLLRTGFDFKGKDPAKAVNIVWAKLEYFKEGKQQSLLAEG